MKIKGKLLATAAGFAAPVMGVSAAGAADMPVKAVPAPAPVTVSWAGWYIGGHAGAYWTHSEFDTEARTARSHSGNGFIGGGQVGINWQNGNAVYGIEVDGSGLTGRARTSFDGGEKQATGQIRWLATVRARMGLAVGNSMAYVTGGLAIGGVKNAFVDTDSPGNNGNKSSSKTRLGWVVGGGVEHMWTRNWTIALEALFVDLGKTTIHGQNDASKVGRFSNQAVIGRVKLNYRF